LAGGFGDGGDFAGVGDAEGVHWTP
jgi:hypothetical protein